MKTKFFKNIIVPCCILFGIYMSSCVPEVELGTPRLFKPKVASVDNTVDNQLTVKWFPELNVINYKIDVCQDSSFTAVDTSITVNGSAQSVIIDRLLAATTYVIRIKAINADSTLNSKYTLLAATTRSIYLNPTAIVDNGFVARWEVRGANVTKIVINNEDGTLLKEVDITPDRALIGNDTIYGLTGSTKYKLILYSDNLMRGSGSFTTRESIKDMVDLRMVDPAKLNDTIAKITDPGKTLVLRRGVNYTISSKPVISKSISFQSGYDLKTSTPATITFGASLDFPATETNIVKLGFKDVNIIGATSGIYFINTNLTSLNIDSISFDNCRISTFRGMIRLKNSEKINNVLINNCVIDSLGDYGMLRIYESFTNIVRNIKVTNSTIYNSRRFLLCNKFMPSPEQVTANIENCTFYRCPNQSGSDLILNFSTTDVTLVASVLVKNCIFATNLPAAVITPPATTPPLAFSFGPSMSLTVDASNFVTSEFVGASSGYQTATVYSGTYTTLFKNAAAHDFTIIDNTFAGKLTAGDPRWR